MKLLERLKALWARLFHSDEFEVECVGHMHKVVFNDGDLFVVTTGERYSVDQRQRVEAYISQRLRGADVLVLDAGLQLGVVEMPRVREATCGAD